MLSSSVEQNNMQDLNRFQQWDQQAPANSPAEVRSNPQVTVSYPGHLHQLTRSSRIKDTHLETEENKQ